MRLVDNGQGDDAHRLKMVETMSENESALPRPSTGPPDSGDRRLYLPNGNVGSMHVKRGADRVYCYTKHPGEDYFHLIVEGEVYVHTGDDMLCLNCAVRHGILTTDRLFWQHRGRNPTSGL